ncbi:AMP-binding protein [sulfur-oxidizing endosymbiont of Gigantopelta aegis]|uniref:AMP-binding protein n=1 Tax=sulfur-oxidizing endosymbiont of Gigantopelta aegis TaxID=2794934 RepID=UPI0018DE6EEB|nr:AMP-binding protein [sulfur-oxidizing endosymbiont of Gigantopelta aegis]
MTHWLIENFTQNKNAVAIVDSTGEYRYQQLLEQIEAYISLLDKTINHATSIAIISDSSFHSIALFIACYLKKLIIVPIIVNNEQELKDKLSVSEVQFILSLEGAERENITLKITPCEPVSEQNKLCQTLIEREHSGLILFSSGSTGKPKAMLHDLSMLLDSYKAKNVQKKPKAISILVFLMFDHIGGINTILNILTMGAKAVIPEDRKTVSIAGIIEQQKVTVLPASPTFLNLMLLDNVSQHYDLSSLRMITYGTETMPESVLKRLKINFPKVKLLQTFGTSETGIAQVSSRSSTSLDIK